MKGERLVLLVGWLSEDTLGFESAACLLKGPGLYPKYLLASGPSACLCTPAAIVFFRCPQFRCRSLLFSMSSRNLKSAGFRIFRGSLVFKLSRNSSLVLFAVQLSCFPHFDAYLISSQKQNNTHEVSGLNATPTTPNTMHPPNPQYINFSHPSSSAFSPGLTPQSHPDGES